MHLPLEIMLPSEDGSASPSSSSFKKVSPKINCKIAKSTQTSQTLQQPKKVTFIKRVKVKKIRSHKHYAEDERDAIWHSPEEYATLKRRCLETLGKMREADFQDCDQFSSRGLEIRTRIASLARKENKALAVRTVLDEQEHQALVGVDDQESIREVYMDISQTSALSAQCLAKRDEKAAREYLGR